MKKRYVKIINDLEKELKDIELKNTNNIDAFESCIALIQDYLNQLRNEFVSDGFTCDEDEIIFFKKIKPSLVSKFIYYAKLFQIESKRPKGGVDVQKGYFENEIQKTQKYFNKNHVFYQYFRGDETYFDTQYFLRKNKSIRIQFDCSGSYIDDQFSTSLDSTFAKFIGYELLIKYCQDEIQKLSIKSNLEPGSAIVKSNLKWTSSKIALIELIYALDSLKAFNNGNADIKQIASGFETIFNIDLGDYYRAFLEIKMRKKNNTKFLDNLKRGLINRILKFDK